MRQTFSEFFRTAKRRENWVPPSFKTVSSYLAQLEELEEFFARRRLSWKNNVLLPAHGPSRIFSSSRRDEPLSVSEFPPRAFSDPIVPERDDALRVASRGSPASYKATDGSTGPGLGALP